MARSTAMRSFIISAFIACAVSSTDAIAEMEEDGFFESELHISKIGSPTFDRYIETYDGAEKSGTIIVDTRRRKLYHVLNGGRAMVYGVGVGREGFQWSGRSVVSRKAEWPGWTPPPEMRKRQPGLPAFMPGGPDNPLGARALYIGTTLYRIHGTNNARTIGRALSSGCIRMLNADVIHLYNHVDIGARVVVH